MYLIQATMSNPSFKIPSVLPPGFHASMAGPGSPAPRVSEEHRSVSGGASSSLRGSQPSSPPPDWDISPVEKAKWDGYFDNLDTAHSGYIKGDIAVGFMLGSKLPVAVLARIWFVLSLHSQNVRTHASY